MGVLDGKRIAVLATDGVEGVELTRSRDAVAHAGATVDIVSIGKDAIQAMNSDIEPAGTYSVDRRVAEASVDDYDGLIMPGGAANADQLRLDEDVRTFVQAFFAADKPVGAICKRTVDAGRSGCGAWAHADVVSPVCGDAAFQCGQQVGHLRRVGRLGLDNV